MPLTQLLSRLMGGLDLSQEEAELLMSVFASGDFAPEQAAGLLVALQVKGATAEELAGMASVLRASALSLSHDFPNLVDTCGTGGGRSTFNLSTGAAIVAAACGTKVAKHGNRSVTSKCGGVDVLEALGVRMSADPEFLSRMLTQTGIVFLFAPNHHGSMKAVGPVRKSLGIRTVFNQLGPLANPAGAKRQLIGVYDKAFVRPMAEALRLLGAERAFVVHSTDGMDEISPCAPTDYAELAGGTVTEGSFAPQDFGLEPLEPAVLMAGSDVAESAKILNSALDRSNPDRSRALVPNAAVALLLAGVAGTLEEASEIALGALESGAAAQKMRQIIEVTSI